MTNSELKALLNEILEEADVDPPIMKFALFEIEDRLIEAIPDLLAILDRLDGEDAE